MPWWRATLARERSWLALTFHRLAPEATQAALEHRLGRREFNDNLPGLLVSLDATGHLYQPLLHVPKGPQVVRIRTHPVALNEGEKRFVDDLGRLLHQRPAFLKDAEVFLLRNQSKTGTGFFQISGFFPDFMLWVVRGTRQWLTFIDPKGLRQLAAGARDPKVLLWRDLQEIETRHPGLGVRLDSWIVSVTSMNDVPSGFEAPGFGHIDPANADHFERLHIVFQPDDPGYVERILRRALEREIKQEVGPTQTMLLL